MTIPGFSYTLVYASYNIVIMPASIQSDVWKHFSRSHDKTSATCKLCEVRCVLNELCSIAISWNLRVIHKC